MKHALLSSLVYDGKIYVYGGSYKTHPIKGTSAIYEYNPMNDPTGLNESLIDIPNKFTLKQNYPNPFNPRTSIKFNLPKTEHVALEVYNTLGQKVATLLDKPMISGQHEVEFNANNLPSGIYFYRIQAGEFHDVKKMVLLK